MFNSFVSAHRFLRNTLRANAGFSLLSGATMLLFGGHIAELLGSVDALLVRVLGLGVAGFGLAVGRTSMRESIDEAEARLIASLDGAWVVGSVVLLVGFPAVFSPLGWWLVLAAALVVADFAIFQVLAARGMQRYRRVGAH